MPDETDLTDAIIANAAKPASATVGDQSITHKKLEDQIAAQRFLNSQRATGLLGGITLGGIIAGGAQR